MKMAPKTLREKHKKHGRQVLRGVSAGAIAVAATVALGATPALASTKLTCNSGFAGTCDTGSLYPYRNGPNDGIFYIGHGTAGKNVALRVIEADTGFVHTYVVTPAATWHDYRGGFNPNKRYFLRVGGPEEWVEGVVVSIENRPL